MKKMMRRVNYIAERKNKFGLNQDVILDPRNINDKDRETFSASESVVFGRDEDLNEIVKLILDNQNNDQLFVIPILGMGGIGKTTLAKLIFNDERLRDRNTFDLRAWAYVSPVFEPSNIGRRLIESLRSSDNNMQNLQVISQELQREVAGKRCLIVLDDVWNVDDQWGKLKAMFKDSSNGSIIIVTTRIEKTAQEIATTGVPHPLKQLSEEVCTQLFEECAFRSEDEKKKYPKLVEIGKGIAMKCGGVALAANVLGSMLSSERDEKHWLYIKNSKISDLHDENVLTLSASENKILSSLKWSYNLMPAHLKLCFAYCAVFPKGQQIRVKKLVKHWISLNFIRPTHDATLSLEEIAQIYLNHLISWSFLQKCKVAKDWNDREEDGIVMHDLMHDLALLIGKEHDIKVFTDEVNAPGADSVSYRFVSLGDLKKHFEFDKFVGQPGKVKSIYLNSDQVRLSDKSFSKLTNLYVLEIEGESTGVPRSITKLKQLRYFSAEHFENHPELQELLIYWTKLKHLSMPGSEFEVSSSSSMKLISRLETLETKLIFSVNEEGVGKGCNIAALQHLDRLDGSLIIRGMEKVKDPKDAEKANLKEMHKLYRLTFYWHVFDSVDKDVAVAVLNALQPSSSSLNALGFVGYRGSEWPIWMMHTQYKLENLHLDFIEHVEILLPSLGQLQHLKTLRLWGLYADNMTKIDRELFRGNEVATFPSLVRLHLQDMEKLEEVWLSMFPNLWEFRVDNCPRLSSVRTQQPSSVKQLMFENFENVATLPDWIGELSELEVLWLAGCPKIESLSNFIKQHPRLLFLFINNHSQALKREVESNFPPPSIVAHNQMSTDSDSSRSPQAAEDEMPEVHASIQPAQEDPPSAEGGTSESAGEGRRRRRRNPVRDSAAASRETTWFRQLQLAGLGQQFIASFLSNALRSHIRLSPCRWNNVPEQEKENVWKLAVNEYPELMTTDKKNLVYKWMGRLVKDWKNQLTEKLNAAEKRPDKAAVIAGLRPTNTTPEDWKVFVDSRDDPDFKAKAKQQSERSKKNKYRTTLGRRNMSTVAAEIELKKREERPDEPAIATRSETWRLSRLHPDPEDPTKMVPLNEDIAQALDAMSQFPDTPDMSQDPVSQFFGPEYPGRVRGLGGYGFTPSVVNLTQRHENRYDHVSQELRRTQQENMEFRTRVTQLEDSVAQMRQLVEGLSQTYTAAHSTRQGPLATPPRPYRPEPMYQPVQRIQLHPNQPEIHGYSCLLLHYSEADRIVVARATITHTAPRDLCHGFRLGGAFFGVTVVAVEADWESLDLPFYYDDVPSLGDSVGVEIAWPTAYIEVYQDAQ